MNELQKQLIDALEANRSFEEIRPIIDNLLHSNIKDGNTEILNVIAGFADAHIKNIPSEKIEEILGRLTESVKGTNLQLLGEYATAVEEYRKSLKKLTK